MIDENGKLFGKVNIIDAGALVLLVLGLLGFFVFRSGRSEAQVTQTETKTIQIDMLIQNSIVNPGILKVGDKVNINIRNQPAGEATIEKVKIEPRLIALAINGVPKNFPDPDKTFGKNITLTLKAQASKTPNGYVIGGAKVKVGIPLEIETYLYSSKASTVDVRPE
jgi:Domain of unknown function (DUF4330)